MSDESVIKHLTETKLKMSEAMRIGAAIRPQGETLLFDGFRSCALGAMYEGAFGKPAPRAETFPPAELLHAFPELRSRIGETMLSVEIMQRNDTAHCTREQIADWLEARGL